MTKRQGDAERKAKEAEFEGIIKTVAASKGIDIAATFLRAAGKTKRKQTHIDTVLNTGLRVEIDKFWGRQRHDLKNNNNRHERQVTDRERTKERKKETAAYATKHNIKIDEVGGHRLKQAWSNANAALEEFASHRAAEIMTKWICDGGKLLADCTGADLTRLGEKEEKTGAGHMKTAAFYFSLSEYCKKGLVKEVDPDDVVACFEEAFGEGSTPPPRSPNGIMIGTPAGN